MKMMRLEIDKRYVGDWRISSPIYTDARLDPDGCTGTEAQCHEVRRCGASQLGVSEEDLGVVREATDAEVGAMSVAEEG